MIPVRSWSPSLICSILLLFADLSTAQERVGAVSGQIMGLDGKPAAEIRVALAMTNDAGRITSESLFSITMTDENGRYRFENIRPGSYGVIAGAVGSPTYFPGTTNNGDAKPVHVLSGTPVNRIDFKMVTFVQPTGRGMMIRPAVLVPGRFVFENGGQSVNVTQEFVPIISGLAAGLSSNGIPGLTSVRDTTAVKPDGTFTLSVYADGDYEFRAARLPMARPDNDFFVMAVMLGSTDLLNKSFKISGPLQDELRVIVGVGSPIRGNVQKEDGKPAVNIQVYLLPGSATPAQYAQRSLIGATGIGNSSGSSDIIPVLVTVATAVTDEQGNFAIRGIAPGDYSLHCEPTGQEGQAPAIQVTGSPIPFQNLTLVSGPPVRRLISTVPH